MTTSTLRRSEVMTVPTSLAHVCAVSRRFDLPLTYEGQYVICRRELGDRLGTLVYQAPVSLEVA